MTNPVLIGLISAGLLLGALGLVRAVVQYGGAGFVAFLEVLFGPAIFAAAAIFFVGRFEDGRLGGLIPSDSTLRRLAYVVVIVGAVGAAITGVFGIGWLLK